MTPHPLSCGPRSQTGIRGGHARPPQNTPATPRGRFHVPHRTTHHFGGCVRCASGPAGIVVAHQPERRRGGAATPTGRHAATTRACSPGCGGGHGAEHQRRPGRGACARWSSGGRAAAPIVGAEHYQTAGQAHAALGTTRVVSSWSANRIPRQAPDHRRSTSVVCAPGNRGMPTVDGGHHRTGPGVFRGGDGGYFAPRCPRVADRQRARIHPGGAIGTAPQNSTGGR